MRREIPASLPVTPHNATSFQMYFEFGLKMSQDEVALRCGTTQPRLSNIANGKSIPLATYWQPFLDGMSNKDHTMTDTDFLRLCKIAVERRNERRQAA